MTNALLLCIALAVTFAGARVICRNIATFFAAFDVYQERDI